MKAGVNDVNVIGGLALMAFLVVVMGDARLQMGSIAVTFFWGGYFLTWGLRK